MTDEILLKSIDLPVQLGVPDEERAVWQVLSADVKLTLTRPFHTMEDDLSNTVDYSKLAMAIKELASDRPRRLLETLASDITRFCLGTPGVAYVEVILRKRILPGLDYVSVRMQRPHALD